MKKVVFIDSKPSEVIEKLYKNLELRVKITFIAATIMGLIAHLYQFTNKIWNYDELGITPSGFGTGLTSGRWFLEFMGKTIHRFFGNESLPLFIGIISILFLAVSAGFIVLIFDIKDKLHCVMIGGLIATFPSITSMFFFMYTSGYYCFAIFLNIIAVYLLTTKRNVFIKYAVVPFFICCSLAIYQAYFPLAVSILVAYLLMLSLKKCVTVKQIFTMGCKYLFVLIESLAFYLFFNKFALWFTNTQLTDYQGVNEIGNIHLTELFSLFKMCYKKSLELLYTDVYNLNSTKLLKFSIIVLGIVTIINLINIVLSKKKEHLLRVLIGFLVFILPVSLFLIIVMVPNGTIYTLMVYPVVLIFILPMIIIEKTDLIVSNYRSAVVFKKISYWLIGVFTSLVIITNIWFANGAYMSLQYTNYHDLSYFQTLKTQIRNLENYDQSLPIVFIGDEISDSTHEAGSLSETFTIGGKRDTNFNAYSRVRILTRYLGFTGNIIFEEEQILDTFNKPEVQSMPCYPEDGAIQIIDGEVVVKFSNEENDPRK